MKIRRRVAYLLAGILVLAALAPAPGLAQGGPESCPTGINPGTEIGPICAQLAPPVTNYHLLDVPDEYEPTNGAQFFTTVLWTETSVSCGRFFVNASAPEGTHLLDVDEYAQWSHANEDPDNCSHEASSHPGTIVAAPLAMVEQDVGTSGMPAPAMPVVSLSPLLECIKTTSASGVGDPCSEAPRDETHCLRNESNTAVTSNSGRFDIFVASKKFVIDIGEAQDCEFPLSAVEHTAVEEVDATQTPTVMVDQTWTTRVPNFTLGIGFEDDGRLKIEGTSGNDSMIIGGMPPIGSAPGGLTVDVNGDGLWDIAANNLTRLDLGLGGGNDRVTVMPSASDFLFRDIPAEDALFVLQVEGDPGLDVLDLDFSDLGADEGVGATRLSTKFGLLSNGATKAHFVFEDEDPVNPELDALMRDLEKITFTGTGGNDTISGAGGDGTGAPVVIPLILSGGGGDDNLTGGKKPDNLKGGDGIDICNGLGGTDRASGCETTKKIP